MAKPTLLGKRLPANSFQNPWSLEVPESNPDLLSQEMGVQETQKPFVSNTQSKKDITRNEVSNDYIDEATARSLIEDALKNRSSTTVQEIGMLTEPQYEQASKNVMGSLPFKNQKEALELLEGHVNQLRAAPTDWYSAPIAALLEAQHGIKAQPFLQGRGMSPDEKQAALLGYQSKIKDSYGDMAQQLAQGISGQKGGYTQNLISSENVSKQLQDYLSKQVQKQGEATTTGNEAVDSTEVSTPKPTTTRGLTADYKKDVAAHQKRMEPLTNLLTTFSTLQEKVAKYPKGKDIPGVGATALLPSAMLSDKGSDIRQTYADLRNQLIYAFSGKQINESEYKRLAQALGSGKLDTDREFRNAIDRFGNTLKVTMEQREAAVKGVNPAVIDLYKKGGGVTSESVKTTTFGSFGKTIVISPEGKKFKVNTEKLDDFLKAKPGWKKAE